MFTKIMIVLYSMFIFVVGYHWLNADSLTKNPGSLTAVESFLILIPVLYYYYELFLFPAAKIIHREPTFWVVTGMFLFFSCITPLFLFLDKIDNYFSHAYKQIYIINFLSYSLLFVCLIIAYLCQIKTSKLSRSLQQ